MSQFSRESDAKLRAACDRCHELKIRCTRTGGTDSRCDRCDKNDIDCVYRAHRRIGRPKSQKSRSDAKTTTRQRGNIVGGHAQQQADPSPPANRNSVHSEFDFSTLEGGNGAEWLSSSSSTKASDVVEFPTHQISTAQTSLFSPDYAFSHEGSTTNSGSRSPLNMLNMGTMPVWDIDLSAVTGPGIQAGRPTSTDVAKSRDEEAMSITTESQSTKVACQRPSEKSGKSPSLDELGDRLLRHQAKLRYLYASTESPQTLLEASNGTASASPPLDRVLEVTVELIETLQTSPWQRPNNNHADNGHLEAMDQQDYNHHSYSDVATLHVFVSYAYIIKILGPVIASLEKSLAPGSVSLDGNRLQTSHDTVAGPNTTSPSSLPSTDSTSSHTFSLGSFSLASQPALNARVLLGVVSRILQQLHDAAHPMISRGGYYHTMAGREQGRAVSNSPSLSISPVLTAAQEAVDSIRDEEEDLLTKLAQLGQSAHAM
ncbi:hypothetical protein FDECE_8700 [Fusarium decemcellulare]|nr:hypothetical protein FDECE_8700 [Fusarium decemcellulare]